MFGFEELAPQSIQSTGGHIKRHAKRSIRDG
jgi:hypothetical protein